MEQWIGIPGYEHYEVSDKGNVHSLPRKTKAGMRGGCILKPALTSSGYLAVALFRDNTRKTWNVHKLVMFAFRGPCPEGQEIRHLDGNRLNNVLTNLKYGTRSDNRLDSVLHGTHRNTRKTCCPQGHKYTPENIYSRPDEDERQCKKCMTIRNRGDDPRRESDQVQ